MICDLSWTLFRFQTLVSFGSILEGVNKENEDMPDYPEEDSPTVKGYKNMANMGSATPRGGGWGFVKTVGDFISNSFYWWSWTVGAGNFVVWIIHKILSGNK